MTETPKTQELPSLADAGWLRAPATQSVFAALAAAGHAARAVGGAVRNAALGLPVTDIDIATPALPDAVMTAARAAGLKVVPTGLEHGTMTVVSGGQGFEVTTLRRDVATDGRRAVVAFTTDWAEDAQRRDFTMNALYCSADGTVHDPLGGSADLMARRVRFIGDAEARIREDYLRILRFFRMHAMYGRGEIDRAGCRACARQVAGLTRLSGERVQAEMQRLMRAGGVCEAVAAMEAYGILPVLLGLAPRPGVLRALVSAETELGVAPDPILRLSALLLAVDEDAARVAETLKLSTADRMALLVLDDRLAEAMSDLDDRAARRRLFALGEGSWRRHVVAAAALRPERLDEFKALHGLPERWPVPRLPVSGRDVLALGVAAGPEVGGFLAELEAWWIDQDFPPESRVRAHLETLAAARKGR
ncbi:MAG: CCA tRNA nucleotidyltransferase [Hyphomicrobiaceae bacterium]